MNKKTKIILVCFVIIIPFLSFGFAFATSQLEVDFPDINGQTLTAKSTLPQTIKYVFSIALVIILSLIVISLIYSGFTYLTSTGNPAKTASSKKQLTGSLLGLAILLSSYLVFRIINPEFLIFNINKVAVNTGILLLNDEAFKDLSVKTALMGFDESVRNEKIAELLSNPAGKPRAMYLAWAIADFRDRLGDFQIGNRVILPPSSEDPRLLFHLLSRSEGGWVDFKDDKEKFNFQDFKLYGLFFLPNTNARVLTFRREDFRNTSGAQEPDNEYVYPNCSTSFGDFCRFRLLDRKSKYNEDRGTGNAGKDGSVPLSIMVEYLSKGVYLRGDDLGEELPVLSYSSTVSDMSIFGFDDKTKEIEIKNWDFEYQQNDGNTPDDPSDDVTELHGVKLKNYLTILHEDKWFKGNLRIFFEKFQVGLEYIGNLPTPAIPPDQDSLIIPWAGANPIQSKIEVKNEADSYGKVNKSSSVQVLEMPQTEAEKERWILNDGCAIHLCTEVAVGTLTPSFSNCLVYNFNSIQNPQGNLENSNSEEGGIPSLFTPFSIPKKAEVEINGAITTIDFENKIKSMKIEGNCAVVLFENRTGDALACFNDPKDCWEDGEPGSRSEVFWSGDGEYPVYKNLTRETPSTDGSVHPIGNCGVLAGSWLNKTTGNPCTSAMAVFPLKIQH